MTRDSGFKRHIRDRARRTGESYSTARAHLRRRSAAIDTDLVSRSAAPIVRHMRGGSARDLTRDQGTLFAFWILFVHSEDGLTGLCRMHPHRVVDSDFWTLIETGLRDHHELLGIIARLRGQLAVTTDLEQLDVDVMRELDAEFKSAMPDSLRRMADYIRAHPDRFTKEVAAR